MIEFLAPFIPISIAIGISHILDRIYGTGSTDVNKESTKDKDGN